MDVPRARFGGGGIQVYGGVGGMGLDTDAAQGASGKFRRLPGAARYIAGALWALGKFQPFQLQLELDGQPVSVRGPVMLAAVANTPTYGAGVRIAPAAEIDDGLLDVVVVSELSWLPILEMIPQLLRTGDARRPELQRFRARRVALRTDRPAPFHGDGEILGATPVEIENLPRAVRVVAPARH